MTAGTFLDRCMAALGGRVGPVRGAIPIYFLPVVSIVAGVVGRGEHVPPLAIGGTGLVVIGAWFASRREPAPSASSAAPGRKHLTRRLHGVGGAVDNHTDAAVAACVAVEAPIPPEAV